VKHLYFSPSASRKTHPNPSDSYFWEGLELPITGIFEEQPAEFALKYFKAKTLH
jgi:hypothetical protein